LKKPEVMVRRGRWVLCGLAVLLAAGFVRAAAEPLADLSGVVYSEVTNQRIRHASVWLCDGGGNRQQESITNDSGQFAFLGLYAGSFLLKVSAPGYQAAEIPVEVNFGAERGISVFLKTVKNSGAGAAAGSIISAHEVSMPQAARDLVDSGKRKLYADKNPQKALNDFESAVAKAPGYYEAYYLIGMTHIALQNPEQAEKNLQKSVELSDQRYADAVLALAIFWIGRHDTVRGEPLLRRGLELNPNSWMGFFELGKLEMYRGQFEAALQAAQNAQALAPEQPLVYRLLSLIHLKQKNYPAALVDLDAYIRLDPDSADGKHAKEIRADTQKRLANLQPPGDGTRAPK
jgi:tetratricopeptide (TPR) repeat protein